MLPEGEEASQPKKYDQDKLRLDLIPVEALTGLGRRFTLGAKKYGDHNWEEGMEWHRMYGAAMRHLVAFWGGEEMDPEEPDHHHLEAALTEVAMLLAHVKRNIGTDNRSESVLEMGQMLQTE